MELEALAKAFPDLTVNITLSDLLKSQETLMRRVREEERKAMERESSDIDDLIPKESVQKKLGVNPSTLWRWEKSGYLSAVRIGTKIYYRLSSVNSMLDAKAVAK